MKKNKMLYEFCKAHYYTDNETLWEPFEDHSEEEVEEFIRMDVIALDKFHKRLNKIKEGVK